MIGFGSEALGRFTAAEQVAEAGLYLEPRLMAYINSDIFIPAKKITVEQTVYGTADTMSAIAPLVGIGTDFGLLSQQISPLPFKVQAGAITNTLRYSGSVFNPIVYGFVDEIDCTYEDDTIEFKGRGVLSLLIDRRISQVAYQNVPVDQAISNIISLSGLIPQMPAQSSGVLVGTILTDDFSAMGRNVRAMDFIQLLCDSVGYNVRVRGTTVIVGPPPTTNAPILDRVWGSPTGGTKLNIRHSALHAHNIKVKVISYIPKSKAVSSSDIQGPLAQELGLPQPVSSSKAKGKTSAGRKTGLTSVGENENIEEYVFHIPGLTQEQCDARAEAIRDEISRHEFIAEYTFAPTRQELALLAANSPEFLVRLNGCDQPSHNQVYHPRQVTWDWDVGESTDTTGLEVSMVMVNHEIPTNTGGE